MSRAITNIFGGGGSGPTNPSTLGEGDPFGNPTVYNGGGSIGDLIPDAPKSPDAPKPAVEVDANTGAPNLPTPTEVAEEQNKAVIQQGKKRGRSNTDLTKGLAAFGTPSLSITSAASRQLLGS